MTDNLIDFDHHPRLTAAEVGASEMWKVAEAVQRFKSFDKARWHAERYGKMSVDKIHMVRHDIRMRQQGNQTCDRALDAYNFARLAHNGWRALRGI